MNTLMAPWLIAYYSDAVFRGSWPDPQFILASSTGLPRHDGQAIEVPKEFL